MVPCRNCGNAIEEVIPGEDVWVKVENGDAFCISSNDEIHEPYDADNPNLVDEGNLNDDDSREAERSH